MALSWLVLDFETRSACDLKACGSWRYSEDPTTDILCCSFQYQGETQTWFPGRPGGDLLAIAEDEEVTFICHNSSFEKAIWRNLMVPVFGFPDVPDWRWHDTMAVCAMKALPIDLERAAGVLRLPLQKDMEGNALTLGLSRPDRKTGAYPLLEPVSLGRIARYCERDVGSQTGIHQRLGWLPQGERKVWLLDQRINQRGIALDLDFIAAARRVIEGASVPLRSEFADLTGGLKVTQGQKLIKWCLDQGVEMPDMKKETLAELLGDNEEDDDAYIFDRDEVAGGNLPGHVRRALAIRKLIGSASIKKLSRMELCVCHDGRARGLLQYHGASPGRWTGRLLQPQNFPRGSLVLGTKAPDPELLVAAIKTGDYAYVETLFGPAVETVVSSLRHAIVARRDALLVAGDFAGIEARIVLALAGAAGPIAAIKQHGSRRAYLDAAAMIFKRPIDKDKDVAEYVAGKATVLGCGFQMGWQTFQSRFGKVLTEDQCKAAVNAYRQDYAPEVPKLWHALEAASLRAVVDRTPCEAYGVRYAVEDEWLTARLPSGRKLWYFGAKRDRKAMPWDPTDVRDCWSYQVMKQGKWTKVYAYGGHETENVVQALARDRMVHAMFLAEKENMPLVLTVHDELVTEPLLAHASAEALTQIMEDQPAWATEMQCPITAEAWAGSRYKK